jgi:hypothetical protein
VEVDQVDGDSGYFGLNDASQSICECEVDVGQLKIDMCTIGLENRELIS